MALLYSITTNLWCQGVCAVHNGVDSRADQAVWRCVYGEVRSSRSMSYACIQTGTTEKACSLSHVLIDKECFREVRTQCWYQRIRQHICLSLPTEVIVEGNDLKQVESTFVGTVWRCTMPYCVACYWIQVISEYDRRTIDTRCHVIIQEGVLP